MSAGSSPPAAPALSSERWQEVLFAPLAGLEPALVAEFAAAASTHLSAYCRLASAPPEVEATELPGRGQLDADRLLAQLERWGERSGRVVVGLTGRDLAIPIFTFVFGRATVGGHAALVSLARLDPPFHGEPPDPNRLRQRGLAEILHELGHVAGLGHCPDANCLMHFSAQVEAIDLRGLAICEECRVELPPVFTGARVPHLPL